MALDVLHSLIESDRSGTFAPEPDYLETVQRGAISVDWRYRVVQWIGLLADTFEMDHDTLALAVNLLDRFLSEVVLERGHVQTAGLAALIISSKLRERPGITIRYVERKLSRVCPVEDVKSAELMMVMKLGWNVHVPTPAAVASAAVAALAPHWPALGVADPEQLLVATLGVTRAAGETYDAVPFCAAAVGGAALFVALEEQGGDAPAALGLLADLGVVLPLDRRVLDVVWAAAFPDRVIPRLHTSPPPAEEVADVSDTSTASADSPASEAASPEPHAHLHRIPSQPSLRMASPDTARTDSRADSRLDSGGSWHDEDEVGAAGHLHPSASIDSVQTHLGSFALRDDDDDAADEARMSQQAADDMGLGGAIHESPEEDDATEAEDCASCSGTTRSAFSRTDARSAMDTDATD